MYKIFNYFHLNLPLFFILFGSTRSFTKQSNENTTEDLPIILGWNQFFGSGNVIRTIAPKEQIEKCAKQCIYSEDKKDASRASAIVFHGTPSSSPPNRNSHQLYVYFFLESPYVSGAAQLPSADFFNISMTYLAANAHNLHAPYGAVHPVDFGNKEDLDDMWREEEILEKIAKKDKLALQIVSNCSPQSGRQFYTTELEKHINVTKRGRCYEQQKKCDNQCYWREIEHHYFYLAFENAVCRNYVTEKFWQPFRHLTVPIVLSRKALRNLPIPADSFIAADDFQTVEELANYLRELQRDKQKYLRYFNWTKSHRRRSEINPPTRAICRLCELAHQKLPPGSKIIPDFYKYWNQGGECQHNFATQFIHPMPSKSPKTTFSPFPESQHPKFILIYGQFFFVFLFLIWVIFIRKFRRFIFHLFPFRFWEHSQKHSTSPYNL